MSDFWHGLLEYGRKTKQKKITFIKPLRKNDYGWFEIGNKIWMIKAMASWSGTIIAEAINHEQKKIALYSDDGGKTWRKDK